MFQNGTQGAGPPPLPRPFDELDDVRVRIALARCPCWVVSDESGRPLCGRHVEGVQPQHFTLLNAWFDPFTRR